MRSRVRPWWGIGEVLRPHDHHLGRFTIRWADGLLSRGQVAELELEEVA